MSCYALCISNYVSATEGGDAAKVGTATVTLSIKNKLEFSSATLTGCVAEGATAGKLHCLYGCLYLSYILNKQ